MDGSWPRWIAGAMCLVAAAAGCRRVEPEPPLPVAVQVVVLTREAATSEMRITATVRERQRVELSFKVPGMLSSWMQVSEAGGRTRDVQEGDVVSGAAGTALARLDDADYRRRLAAAEERLAQAKAKERAAVATLTAVRANYERIKALREGDSVAQQTYDDMLAKKEACEAELDAIRRDVQATTIAQQQAADDLKNCALAVPIPQATVSRKYVERNERVPAGQPVFQIMDLSCLRVAFGVPDTRVAQFRPGQTVAVTADALRGAAFVGRVTKVLPAADLKTRTFEVEVTIDEPRELKPGMVVTVILDRQHRMVLVPMTAVQRGEGKHELTVYAVVEEGGGLVARRRRVAIDGVYDNRIRLVEGSPSEVAAGDTVVATGAFRLTDGQAVRVLEVREAPPEIGGSNG
jgi:RND family efflux transporter MFP subunit